MQIFTELNDNFDLSIALGFFDGVHQGHRVVLQNTVRYAKQHGLNSAVITFKEHPKCFLLNRKPEYIVTQQKRLELIEKENVDFVYVLDFNEQLAKLDALSYLENILVKHFKPKAITTGFNHTFGVNRTGNADFLRINKTKYGFEFFEIPPITLNNILISSSEIRKSIETADFETANNLLDYDFSIEGTVVKGQQLGRTIGFPTANINYPDEIIKFPFGVYASNVEYNGKKYSGVLNYGLRPTVSLTENESFTEVHILNFDEEIYGENIKISPIFKIRDEKTFSTLDDLRKSIKNDVKMLDSYTNHFHQLLQSNKD